VNFRELAGKYEASGGDIRNAVLKAAMAAAGEPGADAFKAIHQRHLEDGIRDVLAGKRVMKQSLFPPAEGGETMDVIRRLEEGWGSGGRWPMAISIVALIASLLALVSSWVAR
jgi:hypothetical protein